MQMEFIKLALGCVVLALLTYLGCKLMGGDR